MKEHDEEQSSKNGLTNREELDTIKEAIEVLRNTPVILDRDLALFFETEVKKIYQYRSRNAERFSDNYAFQLTDSEWKGLRWGPHPALGLY